MKNFLFAISLFVSVLTAHAQTNNYSSLEIGDKVPDVTIQNLMNYSSPTAKISDFKGKLLILDFWSVRCTSCIKEMPGLQQLQEKFGDKLQVLMITTDSGKDIDNLYNKLKFFRNIHLPIGFSDTILSKLFPHNAYGLHVWIDQNGFVKQKTESGSYNAQSIEDYLNGQTVTLQQRNDVPGFNTNVPFVLEGNGRQQTHIKYYSAITENLTDYGGAGTRGEIDSVSNKLIGVRFLNATIITLFQHAFMEWGRKKIYKTIVLTNDSSRLFPPGGRTNNEWKIKNTWCYELKLPPQRAAHLFATMKEDLERFFNLHGTLKKTKMEYWSLRQTSRQTKLITTSGGKSGIQAPEFTDSIVINNMSLKELTQALNSVSLLPVFGHSLPDKLVDLAIHVSPFDAVYLNKQLKKYGLVLKKKRKRMKVLVLADKN